jgi:hypothetical protein
MTELFILSVACFLSLIIAGIALVFSLKALIEIEANKRSTHQIQYVPADDLLNPPSEPMEQLTDEQKKRMSIDPLEAL